MQVNETEISGLFVIDLDIHTDERGNFREVWQLDKLAKLGFPKIIPVQWNVAESSRGVTRGMHAEPWEKYLHVAHGTVFAAVVDVREKSATFGKLLTFELDFRRALLVPNGCANSYQVTSDGAAYSYLVTGHWHPDQKYTAINIDDPTLKIPWPVPKEQRILSSKDLANPTLKELFPNKF